MSFDFGVVLYKAIFERESGLLHSQMRTARHEQTISKEYSVVWLCSFT
jgi:hypothetical protein